MDLPVPPRRASPSQSLPDGPIILGDYDASLLRGVDASRSLTKTAFDGPVACFMDVQEAVFDHAFDRLGLGGAGVGHPVVCTEPLLAPPSARARLAELLFESYGVPSLAFGADAAFAWAHAAQSFPGGSPGGTGLVACLGHSNSTILPILNGIPVNAAAVRLDVAGLTVTQYLADLLRVNFPEFGPALGASAFGRAEELKHALCYVAADYAAEAAAYAAVARSCIGRGGGAGPSNGPFPPGRGVRVQLPWVPKTVKAGAQPLTEEEIQRKEAHRKASVRARAVLRVRARQLLTPSSPQGDRFRAMAAAKRAAKEEAKAAQVSALEDSLAAARSAIAADDPDGAAAALQAAGFDTEAALARAVTVATIELRKVCTGPSIPGGHASDIHVASPQLRGESVEDLDIGDEEPPEEVKYPLLHVPDEELTEEQIKDKRRQRLLHAGEAARARAREAKAAAAAAEAEAQAALEARWEEDPEGTIAELKSQRAALQQRLQARRSSKHASGGDAKPGRHAGGNVLSRRGGEATRQRIRLMAQAIGAGGDEAPAEGRRKRKAAARNEEESDEDPGFGDQEADWQLYRDMDGGSDSEADRQRTADEAALAKVRAQLAAFAPGEADEEEEEEDEWALVDSAAAAQAYDAEAIARWNTPEAHQMLLTAERIRAPELLFQPSMCGLTTVGVAEAVAVALRRSSPELRAALLVGSMPLVLTGGCAVLQGCAARLQAEVMSNQPVGQAMRVHVSGSRPWEDAWRGAARTAAAVLRSPAAVTRAQWMDEGAARVTHRHGVTFQGL